MVEAYVLRHYAVFCAVFCSVIQLCAVEERFGGNASFVEAHSANIVFLDAQYVELSVCRTLTRKISGRPTADDYKIVTHLYLHTIMSPCKRRTPPSDIRGAQSDYTI